MRKKIESMGYKIIKVINGPYIAEKKGKSFKAETLTGLYRAITGEI